MVIVNRRVEQKPSRLGVAKTKRRQRFLKTDVQTGTLEQVPNVVVTERKRNRLARKANERFLRSGIEIMDVYHKLAE